MVSLELSLYLVLFLRLFCWRQRSVASINSTLRFYIPCPPSGKAFLFQFFPSLQDLLAPAEVNIVGRDVPQGLVIPLRATNSENRRPCLVASITKRDQQLPVFFLLSAADFTP